MPAVSAIARPFMIGRDLLSARPSSARLLAFFFGYLAAAGFAETMAITPGTGISIWPPAGLFMVVVVLSKRAVWPWWIAIALGAELFANAIWFHNALGVALLMNAGNAGCALTGALLLRRVRPINLGRLRQIVYLALAGATVAPAISASIGALTLHYFQGQDIIHAWQLWWVGDATGVLTVAPIMFIAAKTTLKDWAPRKRALEIALVSLAFAAGAAISLSGRLPFAYLVMPPLLWAAIRFRFKGAACLVAGLTLMAGVFTVTGSSPFEGTPITERETQMMLQLFLAVSALSAWFVAAISHQQHMAVDALKAANRSLVQRIEAKTQRLQASERDARARVAEIEAIYDAAPVGLVLFDPELRFERINQRLAQINHRAADDHIGRFVEEVLPSATVKVLREVLNRLQNGEDIVELELGGPEPEGGAQRHWLLSYQAIRDGDGRLLNVVGAVAEITERRRNEERASFVAREISHRSKNLLALVSAVARQSLRGSADGREAYSRLEKRLGAIAASHDLLLHGAGAGGASLLALAHVQLGHFDDLIGERIFIAGPDLHVSESAANALGMALHELATNASKYGALSGVQGAVALSWGMDGAFFEISWIETGGPPVTAPERRGFGADVIETMVAHELNGEVSLRYERTGVSWVLRCPAADVAALTDTAILPAAPI